jgi:hypothetical protein
MTATADCTCVAADRHTGKKCPNCKVAAAVAVETRRCVRVAREVAADFVRKSQLGLAKAADEVARRLAEAAEPTTTPV